MPKRLLRRLFGGGNPNPTVESSFRRRIQEFWSWFGENAAQLLRDMKNQRLDVDDFAERINALHPALAWEFCPSHEEACEGFALSGEGQTTIRLLVNQIIAMAPAIEGLTFYTSKQASRRSLSVKVGEHDLDFADYRFSLDFDADAKRLQVTVSHPKFEHIPKDMRLHLAMIGVDNALGENFVEAWIGSIEITLERTPSQKFGWNDFQRQARAAIEVHDMDPDLDPIDRWSGYQGCEPGDGDVQARADVIAGTTCHMELVDEFFDPQREDELAGSGACFAYVLFPSAGLTEGAQTEERARVEDTLIAALGKNHSGTVTGGAFGSQYTYIDLVLFDEHRAVDALRQVLGAIGVVSAASLRFFAKERAEERVVLKG